MGTRCHHSLDMRMAARTVSVSLFVQMDTPRAMRGKAPVGARYTARGISIFVYLNARLASTSQLGSNLICI
jgi:hypothetical protein